MALPTPEQLAKLFEDQMLDAVRAGRLTKITLGAFLVTDSAILETLKENCRQHGSFMGVPLLVLDPGNADASQKK